MDHVYRHLKGIKEDMERQEEYQRKLLAMKDKYGSEVYKIIEGNNRADKLAGAAKGDKGNKFKLYEGSDRFRVLWRS
jgi:hypothetical protein